MFKRTLQIFLGLAFFAQLAGCFYGGHDDRWHHDNDRHYDHPEHHDPAIDVQVHG